MSEWGVRRGKAAFFSGCKAHPATIAPAGSNRSSHGGNEVAAAFGIAGHEMVRLDFRCGSESDLRRHRHLGQLERGGAVMEVTKWLKPLV